MPSTAKSKAPDESAPTTPTAANAENAPDEICDASRKASTSGTTATSSGAVSSGTVTRQRGKTKKSDEKKYCKGSEDKACGKLVQNNALGGIECEVCLKWYHPLCQGIGDDAYAAIKAHNLFWMCDTCKKLITEFRANTEGKTTRDTDDESIARIEKKIDDIGKTLLENTMAMKEEIAKVEGVAKTYSEVVKSHQKKNETDSKHVSANNLQECFESFQHEKDEQAKRKCNLAVVNMPESTATETEERVKEDSELFTDIVKQELRLNVKVEKAIRVGKKTEDRPRVLIVTLKDEETKWEVLKASKALRNSENDIAKNIYINKDMTQKEREKNRVIDTIFPYCFINLSV